MKRDDDKIFIEALKEIVCEDVNFQGWALLRGLEKRGLDYEEFWEWFRGQPPGSEGRKWKFLESYKYWSLRTASEMAGTSLYYVRKWRKDPEFLKYYLLIQEANRHMRGDPSPFVPIIRYF